MGVTAVGRTVSSKTVENDDSEILSRASAFVVNPGTIALANMGTSPSAVEQRGTRFSGTSGSGTPTAAATITIPHRLGKTPSKVWLDGKQHANGFYVVSVSATNIVIGVKNAPAASTAYAFELIVE